MGWARTLVASLVLVLVSVVAVQPISSKARPEAHHRPQMLIGSKRLATLPVKGHPYRYLKKRADGALRHMNLSARPSAASPWLSNYRGSGSVTRPGAQTLAAALVYARTGKRRYRHFVIRANRYLIGSEQSASTDGTGEQDRLLATARQLGAYVVAASLVHMDPGVTGSRPGWGATRWRRWLSALRTEPIGSSGQAATIRQLSDERANNWGSFARAARIAIDIYLGDRADLKRVVARYKLFLGERRQTDRFHWSPDQSLDLSYACTPNGGSWSAINPSGCGPGKDGLIVEDISRSASGYPSYDRTGIGYTMESYQAVLFSAVLLQRYGYSPFKWGDKAMKRVMDWLTRQGIPQGNGTTVERHESWVARHFYDRRYPRVPSSMGYSLGFTDWLYRSR
jgi:hypothetical protein